VASPAVGEAEAARGETDSVVDSSTKPPRVPLNHRAAPTACSHDRPALVPAYPDAGRADTRDGGECITDEDCTFGTNGRCEDVPTTGAFAWHRNVCTYDECFADSDCTAGAVCMCREFDPFEHPGVNRCATGNCRTDADCNGNYCSLSHLENSVYGYYCHTREDECVDDTDCHTAEDESCGYDGSVGKWRCAVPPQDG
jgi:hypothetical protein